MLRRSGGDFVEEKGVMLVVVAPIEAHGLE